MSRSLKPPSHTSDSAIVLCADRKYFAPAYVVCMSLMEDQPEPRDVYLLTETGPHLDLVPRDVPFNILTPDFVNRLPNVPELWSSLTPFQFLRMLLPEVVPGYRRILYLDSDVRIDGSLAPLFSLDMKGAALAAVVDATAYSRAPAIRWKAKLLEKAAAQELIGLARDDPYFNSGVLLIDCGRWVRDRMSDAAIDCMARIASNKHRDQDVLNVVFRNAWVSLSPRWNFPSSAFGTDLEALLKPVIYHSIAKPWNFDHAHPREAAYFRAALSKTPYRDFARRPSFSEVKRYVERRGREMVQYATFFLPSSASRLQDRRLLRKQPKLVEYIIANVRSRGFADVDQNISAIDISALSSLLDA
jgi:lipopolysaccharide biosynthesis glycosyltransferase